MGRKITSIEFWSGFNKTAGKIRRAINLGLLGAGATVYGLHRLTEDPDERMMREFRKAQKQQSAKRR